MLIGASETDERSSSRASSRLQTLLARQVTSAAMATAAANLAASLSYRVAMRCQSFNRQNMRSMKIAAFVGAGIERMEVLAGGVVGDYRLRPTLKQELS